MALDDDAEPGLWQRRRGWIIGGLVALALLAWFTLRGGGEAAPSYVTAAVERGDVVARVSASGTLSATVTVDVGSQVSGRIASLFADYNSVVKKGQRIAKIDPSLFEASVAQARANVIASEANVLRLEVQADEAKRQRVRSETIYETKLISENDRDAAVANARAAEAAVAQARGQLAQARAALQQAATNLRYTDILAPTDGIVISRAVNVGQTVAASLQAPTIFTIAQDLRAMEVHTNVAEGDIGRLAANMPASFTVDAYPGERFEGRIREIRNAPQVVQNVVTYDAVIDVANPELKLKPGMTAAVTVVFGERDGVLRVPNAALRFRPPQADGASGGGRDARASNRSRPAADEVRGRTVHVLEGETPRAVQVETGLSDGTFTEVLSGLTAGQNVITGLAGGSGAGGMGGSSGGGGRRSMGPRIL